jgi:hypothetical protein
MPVLAVYLHTLFFKYSSINLLYVCACIIYTVKLQIIDLGATSFSGVTALLSEKSGNFFLTVQNIQVFQYYPQLFLCGLNFFYFSCLPKFYLLPRFFLFGGQLPPPMYAFASNTSQGLLLEHFYDLDAIDPRPILETRLVWHPASIKPRSFMVYLWRI